MTYRDKIIVLKDLFGYNHRQMAEWLEVPYSTYEKWVFQEDRTPRDKEKKSKIDRYFSTKPLTNA